MIGVESIEQDLSQEPAHSQYQRRKHTGVAAAIQKSENGDEHDKFTQTKLQIEEGSPLTGGRDAQMKEIALSSTPQVMPQIFANLAKSAKSKGANTQSASNFDQGWLWRSGAFRNKDHSKPDVEMPHRRRRGHSDENDIVLEDVLADSAETKGHATRDDDIVLEDAIGSNADTRPDVITLTTDTGAVENDGDHPNQDAPTKLQHFHHATPSSLLSADLSAGGSVTGVTAKHGTDTLAPNRLMRREEQSDEGEQRREGITSEISIAQHREKEEKKQQQQQQVAKARVHDKDYVHNTEALAEAARLAFGGRVSQDAATSALATATVLMADEPVVSKIAQHGAAPRERPHTKAAVPVASFAETTGNKSSTPGNVKDWIQEMGKCVRKGNELPAGIVDAGIVQKGKEAMKPDGCAAACSAHEECASFQVQSNVVIAASGMDPMNCLFFAGIHIGDHTPGVYCYVSVKWAQRSGMMAAPPKDGPTPEEVELMKRAMAEKVPGEPGPPGEPGLNGKDMSGSGYWKKITFVLILLNAGVTGYLFFTLFKEMDAKPIYIPPPPPPPKPPTPPPTPPPEPVVEEKPPEPPAEEEEEEAGSGGLFASVFSSTPAKT